MKLCTCFFSEEFMLMSFVMFFCKVKILARLLACYEVFSI